LQQRKDRFLPHKEKKNNNGALYEVDSRRAVVADAEMRIGRLGCSFPRHVAQSNARTIRRRSTGEEEARRKEAIFVD
jgi:hypothetical protein